MESVREPKPHVECVEKLMIIGRYEGFIPTKGARDKRYQFANPDCLWYCKNDGMALKKIARGDGYESLPVVAFEVAYSEGQKGLRGSLMSLQVTNAAAGVIVLMGKSMKYKSYLKRLVGRYSYMRVRIWTEEIVNRLYNEIPPMERILK